MRSLSPENGAITVDKTTSGLATGYYVAVFRLAHESKSSFLAQFKYVASLLALASDRTALHFKVLARHQRKPLLPFSLLPPTLPITDRTNPFINHTLFSPQPTHTTATQPQKLTTSHTTTHLSTLQTRLEPRVLKRQNAPPSQRTQ